MKLIIGLGNVGERYTQTRHNLGFMAVERLANDSDHQPSSFARHSKAKADILDLRPDLDAMLVKPTTMMNLSGQAVRPDRWWPQWGQVDH
jgi:PTH1 family peptidyl-tRNA hydrolase